MDCRQGPSRCKTRLNWLSFTYCKCICMCPTGHYRLFDSIIICTFLVRFSKINIHVVQYIYICIIIHHEWAYTDTHVGRMRDTGRLACDSSHGRCQLLRLPAVRWSFFFLSSDMSSFGPMWALQPTADYRLYWVRLSFILPFFCIVFIFVHGIMSPSSFEILTNCEPYDSYG